MDELINQMLENLPWLSIPLLLVGFVLLIKGADLFVDGASSLAKSLRVPGLIIGMTVVALGTSLPELAVSVSAAFTGSNALAISNAIGSNIFNLMVVLGSAALFSTMMVTKDTLKRDFPFSIFCAGLLLLLGLFGWNFVEQPLAWNLDRIDGAIFVGLFVVFMVVMVRTALKARRQEGASVEEKTEGDVKEDEIKLLPLWKAIIFIVIGMIAIKFGGDFVVDGAVKIATMAGISQNLVGLTIVACGTSLPELVTSVVAARKNELDMAVGNVVGSNIFNILLILGTSALITKPGTAVVFGIENIIDIAILIGFSVLVYIFCGKDKKLSRKEGIVMLALYATYLVYICVR